MSSFLGHSLAAWTIAPLPTSRRRWLWLGWLTVVALAPDCDYVVPWLHPSANSGLRITHGLLSCQVLPLLTILWLWWRGMRAMPLLIAGVQLVGAGLSHVVLDLLVGVTALPLLWPFDAHRFKLPFGILPSAGKISLTNTYFYFNLIIELGVLGPLSAGIFALRRARRFSWELVIVLALLGWIARHYAIVAYGLSR